MFTGLIQSLGTVRTIEPTSFGRSIHIEAVGWRHRPRYGESIAVNGCCLTLGTKEIRTEPLLHFDVVRQTLEVTSLGDLQPGDQVNLEHAATPATLLGGHIVQGHIDCTAEVIALTADDTQHRLAFRPADCNAISLIVERGSIAVNGVSLTVASVADDAFEVALIPTTLRETNLGALKVSDRVNLECDYLAKIVVNWLARTGANAMTVPA